MQLKKIGILILVLGVLLFGAYRHGYSTAETEGRLTLEEYKTAQKAAQEARQAEVIKDYEKRIKKLTSDLSSVRGAYAERVQQLKQFNNAGRDLETCQRERRELSRLAVEGEGLLKEADSYFEALKQ